MQRSHPAPNGASAMQTERDVCGRLVIIYLILFLLSALAFQV
jgi:hypothetical protein